MGEAVLYAGSRLICGKHSVWVRKCISKHGICTPKSPLVCGFAPKTPVLKGEKNNESKYK